MMQQKKDLSDSISTLATEPETPETTKSKMVSTPSRTIQRMPSLGEDGAIMPRRRVLRSGQRLRELPRERRDRFSDGDETSSSSDASYEAMGCERTSPVSPLPKRTTRLGVPSLVGARLACSMVSEISLNLEEDESLEFPGPPELIAQESDGTPLKCLVPGRCLRRTLPNELSMEDSDSDEEKEVVEKESSPRRGYLVRERNFRSRCGIVEEAAAGRFVRFEI